VVFARDAHCDWSVVVNVNRRGRCGLVRPQCHKAPTKVTEPVYPCPPPLYLVVFGEHEGRPTTYLVGNTSYLEVKLLLTS
jgi:hypothetical protein